MTYPDNGDPGIREHVRLLAVFHYIFTALALLGIGFLFFHYKMMSTLMSPEFMRTQPNPPPQGFLDVFVWFYVVMGTFLLVGGILNLLAAHFLRTTRHRMFCMVIGGLNCLQVPFGTVLGVFTLVVLTQDAARLLFDGSEPPMPSMA